MTSATRTAVKSTRAGEQAPRTIAIGPGLVEVHVTGEQSGGQMDVLIFNAPAGTPGPAPHRHPAAEETFHVLEGEMEFVVDGRTLRAGPGTTVHVPRGVPHAFRYIGDRPVRFLAVLSPSLRMDEYFERLAALVKDKPRPFDEPTRTQISALMMEYGQEPG